MPSSRLCSFESTVSVIIADSYDSCRWTFGDGGYSSKKDPEWIFDVEGEYKVVFRFLT